MELQKENQETPEGIAVGDGRSSHMDMVVWPGMLKMTFTLDETTVEILKRVADRLQKPQSHVLREAIRYYEPHAGQLNKEERKRRLELFDRVIAAIPSRPVSEVDRELREVRASRRSGWQRKPARKR